MNLILRIGAALFFGGFLVYVLRLVSNGKMLLNDSLLLSLFHISETTGPAEISYCVFCF